MITNYKDIINGKRTFNLVNSDDLELQKIGLEPLYFKTNPLYINLHGNVYYGGSDHYRCCLHNDIIEMLGIMNSNDYDRFERVCNFLNDNYNIYFRIHENQIYFCDFISLKAWKKFPHIREELTQKYNLCSEYYEPTEEEIFDHYDYKKEVESFFSGKFSKAQLINYNLTPKEYLDIRYEDYICLYKPYTDFKNIDNDITKTWINRNANIFLNWSCRWDKKGVYNEETMNIINNLKETKKDILMALYNLASKTDNMKKLVHDLMVEFKVYHEFEIVEHDHNDFCTGYEYDEMIHWDNMFYKSAYDILVQLIGFDKIETQLSKTITTTKANIYEEFYNLILLGYDIVQIPKLIFDEDNQKLRWIKPNDFVQTAIDRECEEELKLIKKYFPYDQRDRFLRD